MKSPGFLGTEKKTREKELSLRMGVTTYAIKYDITETPNPWKRILGLEKIWQIILVAAIIGLIKFWRPHTTWAPKR